MVYYLSLLFLFFATLICVFSISGNEIFVTFEPNIYQIPILGVLCKLLAEIFTVSVKKIAAKVAGNDRHFVERGQTACKLLYRLRYQCLVDQVKFDFTDDHFVGQWVFHCQWEVIVVARSEYLFVGQLEHLE